LNIAESKAFYFRQPLTDNSGVLMRYKPWLFFLIILSLFSSALQAQTTTYAGVVKDSISGLGLSGITVKVLGTALETSTAGDGSYAIPNAPRNSPLLFGGTNYATKIVAACAAKPGDANASGTWTLADIIAIVNYIFNKPGCSPQPACWLSNLLCRGDWNESGTVSLSDVIRGVNYIFNKPGGPWNALPVGTCCLP
jgi:hypothetical protein